MTKTSTYAKDNKPSAEVKQQIINFLFTQLGEFGDPANQIEKAIDYSLEEYPSFGGFVATIEDEQSQLLGAVVVNQTGMGGYIPENILVYIATDSAHRGKGLGKALMQHAIDTAVGDIALHVEPHNPAKRLYERLGFTNKYLEMRLQK